MATVKVQGIDKLLARLDSMPAQYVSASEKATYKTMTELKNEITEISPKDTGAMVRSYTIDIKKTGNSVRGELYPKKEYTAVMEEGRKPGKFPPPDSLVSWAGRKGLIGSVTKKYDDLSSKDKGTIFVIARSIARKGIEGKHMFAIIEKTSLPKSSARFKEYLINELK